MGPRQAAALVVLLGLVSAGCAERTREAPPSLLLITIDTLRADHVRSYGYFRKTSPHIDRLAAGSLLCEYAVAPMATTLPSHVSMLTGTYPARHGVDSNFRFIRRAWRPGEGLRSIAQMLQARGYGTAAFTSSSPLCADTGIDAGFDTFVAPPVISVARGRVDRPAGRTVDAALSWLETAGHPFFLWVHLFDPHDPYRPPPPYDEAFTAGPELMALLEARGFPDPAAAAPVVDRYDGEVLYADSQVGRLLDSVEARGLRERTVVVLAGDHGEGLGQHGEPRHGGIWNEQLTVPLLIQVPGREGGRLATPVSLIDVAPTLAGAGLPLDRAQFDGVDLAAGERRFVLAQEESRKTRPRPRLVLTGPRWKYTRGGSEGPRLFDLSRDPHELEDVISRHPEVAASMAEALEGVLAHSASRPAPPASTEVPELLREQLEALGYLE